MRLRFLSFAIGIALSTGCSSAPKSSPTTCNDPISSYAAPMLLAPASDATAVPDRVGVLYVQAFDDDLSGTFALVSSSGSIALGSPVEPPSPAPSSEPTPTTAGATVAMIAIPTLSGATAYKLTTTQRFTGTYCGPFDRTYVDGTFTTK